MTVDRDGHLRDGVNVTAARCGPSARHGTVTIGPFTLELRAMSLRRRTYPEVLENLLTAIVGGVAAEAHPFPPPGSAGPPHRSLLRAAAGGGRRVRRTGARDGAPHLFRKGVDYVLSDDGTAIDWPAEGAEYPMPARSCRSATGREGAAVGAHRPARRQRRADALPSRSPCEMAGLYAQLEAVYDVGVRRHRDRQLAGQRRRAARHRARARRPRRRARSSSPARPEAAGTITIPAGTRVPPRDGRVEYETTATVDAVARRRTRSAVAGMRDLDPNDPLPAGTPHRAGGADRRASAGVTNPAPTAHHARRTRPTPSCAPGRRTSCTAASGRRCGALKEAIARQEITADVESESRRRPGSSRSRRTPRSSRPSCSSGC